MNRRTLLFCFAVLVFAVPAWAGNRYVPPFILRATNTNYVRVTNLDAGTKHAQCVGVISAGASAGAGVMVPLTLSGSGTGDCQPAAGVEWIINAIVHDGPIAIGYYNGSTLLNFGDEPKTWTYNVYVPPFVLRATNGYRVRISNTDTGTKAAECVGIVASGTGTGSAVIVPLSIAESGTGDCQPSSGVEWIIQGIVHAGTVDIGYYDGSALLNITSEPSFKPEDIKTCEIIFGDPATASPELTNDNDAPNICGDNLGIDYRIIAASCISDAASDSPTVTPILTGGSGTSIVTGAITCGTSWAAGTINGKPIVHSFDSDGAMCSTTPCTIDANITAAGTTAKYLVLRLRMVK